MPNSTPSSNLNIHKYQNIPPTSQTSFNQYPITQIRSYKPKYIYINIVLHEYEMKPAQRNPNSLIKQSYQNFECPLCAETYDSDKKYPMILCPEQHSACLTCVNTILFKKKAGQKEHCPYCKKIIFKENVTKFRHLNEIRQISRRLDQHGSTIRRTMKQMDQQKLRDKELIEWLVKQNQQNISTIREKNQKIADLQKHIWNLSFVIEHHELSPKKKEVNFPEFKIQAKDYAEAHSLLEKAEKKYKYISVRVLSSTILDQVQQYMVFRFLEQILCQCSCKYCFDAQSNDRLIVQWQKLKDFQSNQLFNLRSRFFSIFRVLMPKIQIVISEVNQKYKISHISEQKIPQLISSKDFSYFKPEFTKFGKILYKFSHLQRLDFAFKYKKNLQSFSLFLDDASMWNDLVVSLNGCDKLSKVVLTVIEYKIGKIDQDNWTKKLRKNVVVEILPQG